MIAICGTGMGSLAGLLKKQGYDVIGSDANVYPPMSTQLENLGIKVLSPYAANNIENARPDLVIVGNAISANHPEAQYLTQSGIPFISMPEALNHFFLREKEVIVVCGTHGKTTTTALMAFLLTKMGHDPSYLIGGVPHDLPASFHIGSGPYFVIEGDEYDTAFFDKGPKFLHYNPAHVIMTSLEFDHADIYQNVEQIYAAFERLARLIPEKGSLHICDEYPLLKKVALQSRARVIVYGDHAAEFQICDFKGKEDGSIFSLSSNGKRILSVSSPLAGMYNAQNVAACFSVLYHLSLDLNSANLALDTFQGIKRRQEVLFDDGRLAVIDDFAHHPTAVAKTIAAIRQKFPDRFLLAVFEPRSNTSRRKVFQHDFAKSFSLADAVVLAQVFMPEKIPEDQRLDVEELAVEINSYGKSARLIDGTDSIIKEILSFIDKTGTPVVSLIMSNGGFDNIHKRLITAYHGR